MRWPHGQALSGRQMRDSGDVASRGVSGSLTNSGDKIRTLEALFWTHIGPRHVCCAFFCITTYEQLVSLITAPAVLFRPKTLLSCSLFPHLLLSSTTATCHLIHKCQSAPVYLTRSAYINFANPKSTYNIEVAANATSAFLQLRTMPNLGRSIGHLSASQVHSTL